MTREYHSSIGAGRVISQNPSAGTSVNSGRSVNLVVSQGPKPQSIAVPNVVGSPLSSAETTLVNAGFVVGSVTQEYSSTVANGAVISQNPAAGSLALPGRSVNLVVSRGPKQITVPNVVGKFLSAAETALTGAGLSLGTVTEEYSATAPAGSVISQNPSAGTNAASGTSVDLVVSKGLEPISLSSIEEIQRIGRDKDYPINGHYVLAQNINASATSGWNDGKGFDPIGKDTNRFIGRFDGQGYAISGLVINLSGSNYVGLFGYVGAGGMIENVSVISGSITGSDYTGGLAGACNGGRIENCHTTSAVVGRDYVGGLVGANSGQIAQCSAAGAVTGGSRAFGACGGLVGVNDKGDIEDSSTTGPVVGVRKVGGLAGWNSGNIKGCLAEGNVSGTSISIGGLLGINEDGSVMNCAATGEISGGGSSDYLGGLVGWASGTVAKSWATGNVMGGNYSGYAGGLIGYANSISVSQCFAEGSVVAYRFAGGLIGSTKAPAIVAQSHASGGITTTAWAGGLIGSPNGGTVMHCYSIGAVVGDSSSGGLIGARRYTSDALPTVSGSFWDMQFSGMTESLGGEGRTTAQMMDKSTFTSAGWDFVEVWAIENGLTYPYLRWAFE